MRVPWIALLLLCACNNAPTATSVALSDVGPAYGDAYCGRVFACCSADDIARRFAGDMPPVTDRASCSAVVGRGFGNEFMGDVGRAQVEGRAIYHGDEMAACMDRLRSLDCATFATVLLLPSGCDPVEGLVADGGACGHDLECRSGYCEGDTSSAEGACKPMPQAGQVCREGICAAELHCAASASPPTCEPLRADGESCASGLECTSGSCNGTTSTTRGTCGPPVTCFGS